VHPDAPHGHAPTSKLDRAVKINNQVNFDFFLILFSERTKIYVLLVENGKVEENASERDVPLIALFIPAQGARGCLFGGTRPFEHALPISSR
jgi:hypothetical protein